VAGVAVSADHDEFYLVATRLLGYKRVDLAVRAFAGLDRDLIVVGDGPERGTLERLAGPRTRFVGHIERTRLLELIRRCRALIAPGTEDFGIVPVEAMAAGRPVVAFGAGGALETVVDGRTGILFESASQAALAGAIERFEATAFDPAVAHEQALRFDRSVFRDRWAALLIELGLGDVAPSSEIAPSPGER
jgi:glycosyltransferase involved in cell wall biosynthesis